MLSTTRAQRLLQQSTRRLFQIRGFSRRDAPLPPLTNPVLNAIEEARKKGEFDNLSGAGKPLSKVDHDLPPAGMTSTELLSKKAEFEMRRAIRNRELEDIGGEGEKLTYKGTGEVGSADAAMGSYIVNQVKPSFEDMKKIKK